MKVHILFFAVTIFVIGAAALITRPTGGETALAKDVEECNTVATQLRFSCYRKAIEEHYAGEGLTSYVQTIEDNEKLNFKVGDDITYAVFGANCHTFYHALGDFAAMHADSNLRNILYTGPTKCTAGYLMGLYKRMALEEGYPTELLKEFYAISRPEERVQAAHEIGHNLHDKYTTAVLSVVDDISSREYGMQFPEEYQYTTFPDRQADLNAPFGECDEIIPEEDAKMRLQCRSGIGHNMFVFSEFDPEGYKNQFAQCEKSSAGENREDCYAFLIFRIGINEGATKFLSGNFDKGNEICRETAQIAGNESMVYHCYTGIGGGIGLFIDSEYPPDTVTDENVEYVKEKLEGFMGLCKGASDEEFTNRCYAGLFGTRFADLYDQLNLYNEKAEILRPNWRDTNVTG